MHGPFIHPIIGIPAILLIFSLMIYQSIDVALSKGVYLSVHDRKLYLKGKYKCDMSDIKVDSIILSGLMENILKFELKDGKEISISLFFVSDSPSSVFQSLKLEFRKSELNL